MMSAGNPFIFGSESYGSRSRVSKTLPIAGIGLRKSARFF